MSTVVSETKIQEPAPILPSPSQEKVVTCQVCLESLLESCVALECVNKSCKKVTCKTCAKQMVDVFFGEPTVNQSLKCSTCSKHFNKIAVDQVFSETDMYEYYISCMLSVAWFRDCLNDDEQLAQCPFCPYVEIHTTDSCTTHFLACQNPKCGKNSCLLCKHAIPDQSDQAAHERQCLELNDYRTKILDAIEKGSLAQCPNCELRGIKDDNCTHMSCVRCFCSWCYICGKSEDECDVDAGSEQNLGSHNSEWETNPNRCPMYLSSIYAIDSRWPSTDSEALEYLHRCRTTRLLYEIMEELGKETLEQLDNTFGLITNTGFTIEEIEDEDNRILIQYAQTDDT